MYVFSRSLGKGCCRQKPSKVLPTPSYARSFPDTLKPEPLAVWIATLLAYATNGSKRPQRVTLNCFFLNALWGPPNKLCLLLRVGNNFAFAKKGGEREVKSVVAYSPKPRTGTASSDEEACCTARMGWGDAEQAQLESSPQYIKLMKAFRLFDKNGDGFTT